MPLFRFLEPVVRILKVCGLFGLAVFAFFAAQAAPGRLASISSSPPATVQASMLREGPPIFFLTFEKLVASYLTDDRGRILKDRFPHLARFVQEADYYPQAYASSTATVYALKTLYSGRQWTTERSWSVHPTIKSILGAGRRNYMVLDVLTEYCRPPEDVCIRTIGQERFSSRDLLIAWYKQYLHATLPDPIEAYVLPALGIRLQLDTAWDIWGRENADRRTIGLRQFDRLEELVQAQGQAPNLYIMHNFISDEPPVATSRVLGVGGTESARRQELDAARDNLMAFDAALGEFLDRLRASGLYDHALIFITSDTGFDPGYRHVKKDAELPFNADMLRIFLAMKRPGQREGRVLPAPIQQVDVLPTLLQDLGIDPRPFQFNGIAVTNPEQTPGLAQRPVQFTIASELAGILYYHLSDPQGPLHRTKRF